VHGCPERAQHLFAGCVQDARQLPVVPYSPKACLSCIILSCHSLRMFNHSRMHSAPRAWCEWHSTTGAVYGTSHSCGSSAGAAVLARCAMLDTSCRWQRTCSTFWYAAAASTVACLMLLLHVSSPVSFTYFHSSFSITT
jgi:hypothetical protein